MIKSLLEIGTILPPLLERQISPPYRIVEGHLDYLQKWREYLFGVWTDDFNKDTDQTDIQKAVDDLISTILLIDFVRQTEPTTIPSVEKILRIVSTPTAYNLCEAVRSQISCRLLKCIFSPDRLTSPDIGPQKKVNWSSLTYISDAADAFYSCRMPITIFGDFHQLCIEHPVAGRKAQKKSSERRNKGIHYTPAPLVDYLVFHTLSRAF